MGVDVGRDRLVEVRGVAEEAHGLKRRRRPALYIGDSGLSR